MPGYKLQDIIGSNNCSHTVQFVSLSRDCRLHVTHAQNHHEMHALPVSARAHHLTAEQSLSWCVSEEAVVSEQVDLTLQGVPATAPSEHLLLATVCGQPPQSTKVSALQKPEVQAQDGSPGEAGVLALAAVA